MLSAPLAEFEPRVRLPPIRLTTRTGPPDDTAPARPLDVVHVALSPYGVNETRGGYTLPTAPYIGTDRPKLDVHIAPRHARESASRSGAYAYGTEGGGRHAAAPSAHAGGFTGSDILDPRDRTSASTEREAR